jgi:hypothetical protein
MFEKMPRQKPPLSSFFLTWLSFKVSHQMNGG